MEELILPLLQANPDYERLDGLTLNGKGAGFATFEHFGRKWRLASDTKPDRIITAWKLYQDEKESFVLADTGRRRCLRLNNGGSGKANGLFIYEV